jgi:hypothetical protein
MAQQQQFVGDWSDAMCRWTILARLIFVALTAISLPTCASGQPPRLPASATPPGNGGTRGLVIFGGFAYVDENQQAWLSNLIKRDAAHRTTFSEEGRTLEEAVAAAARKVFAPRLTKWSTQAVVFDFQDLKTAFEGATGLKDVVNPRVMFGRFDRAYAVVLTSGFEYHTVLRTVGRDVTYHAYAEVSVAASLVDINGSGNVLLSTSVLGIDERRGLTTQDPLDSPVWAERYRSAYAAGAEKALALLQKLADKIAPSALDSSSSTYMVTGAVLLNMPGQASRLAAKLFDWQFAPGRGDLESDIGTACAPVNRCLGSSKGCSAMTGFLVSAVSEALSQDGRGVEPPMVWRAGTRPPDRIVRYKLALPATPLPELVSSTELTFDPQRAANKTVATLIGLDQTTGTGPIRSTDSYAAYVDAWVEQPDPVTCKRRPNDGHFLTKSPVRGSTEDTHPVNEAALDADSQRFLYLRAIHDAAKGMMARPDLTRR